MRIFKSLVLSILLFIVSTASIAQANKIYFPYFELINLEENAELQYSTSRLVKTYIETNHDYHILLPEKASEYYAANSYDIALKAALERKSDHVLIGEIHSLDGIYIVSLGLYETSTGKKLWHDLVKGISNEDLDPLLSRLGRNFMTETKASDDVEIGEVTAYEAQGAAIQQIKANHFFGLMIGGNSLIGGKTLSGFGIAYSFDANTVIFTGNFDYYFSPKVIENLEIQANRMESGSLNLGILYPLSRKRMTWFLNGGMEYSFIQLIDDTEFYTEDGIGGISVFMGGGYLLNRNSTVNMRIHAGLSFPTYRIGDSYYPSLKFGVTTSIAR